MIQAYVKMWKNAFNFSGRATRGDYWWAVLANMIIAVAIGVVMGILTLILAIISEDLATLGTILTSIVAYGYSFIAFIPGLSLVVRRLHDTGKSGWMYLICALGSACCGIGGIILLVFMCTDSQPGPNQWGPNPKGMDGMYGANGYGQNPQMNNMYGQSQQMNNMNGYNQNNGFNQNNNNQF